MTCSSTLSNKLNIGGAIGQIKEGPIRVVDHTISVQMETYLQNQPSIVFRSSIKDFHFYIPPNYTDHAYARSVSYSSFNSNVNNVLGVSYESLQ